jgi:hypothetical protein
MELKSKNLEDQKAKIVAEYDAKIKEAWGLERSDALTDIRAKIKYYGIKPSELRAYFNKSKRRKKNTTKAKRRYNKKIAAQ